MGKNKDENKKNNTKWLGVLVFVLLGFISGLYSGIYIFKRVGAEAKAGELLPLFAWLIICIYLSMLIQIVVHEGGHLIFGLISGYRFISYRVGSLMLLKDNGRYKLKKFNIAGTGGQCLMLPPESKGYDYPYLIYNLGGAIANVVFALFALLLNIIVPDNLWGTLFLSLLFLVGMGFALINGIPMKLGGIANDGYNVLSLGKASLARQIFWVQLTINGLIASGKRLRDMPAEWFEFSADSDLTNHFNCSSGAVRCSYLNDLHRFEEAKELSRLLINASGCLEIYKNELRCELMFYEMLGLCRVDEIEKLYTKDLQKYINLSSSFSISRRRLLYGYELLVKQNEKEAEKHLKAFEKATRSYPFTGEIESERELIGMITRAVEGRLVSS